MPLNYPSKAVLNTKFFHQKHVFGFAELSPPNYPAGPVTPSPMTMTNQMMPLMQLRY